MFTASVTVVTKRESAGGRTVLGPKRVGERYARIISQNDGSGRIEAFDTASQRWIPADNISFGEIWSAPVLSALIITQIVGKPRQK
jgi:hypothetical protein